MSAPTPDHPLSSYLDRLREVALLFTRLGCTAFGGPAAHTAMMEDEVVHRRHWLDRRHFLDLVSTLNFIPGPNSTELAIHLGLIRAGFAGLLVAGTCFITPAVLIILPLAWAYVRFGTLPQVQSFMAGVSAAVIGIIAVAAFRFGRTAIHDAFTGCIAVAALAGAVAVWNRPGLQPELLILGAAACAGIVRAAWPIRPLSPDLLPMLMVSGLAAAAQPSRVSELWRMTLFFLKVGATLFGSGYVLVSYLQSGLVDTHHWLTQRELLNAISVGQVTPGPLLTTATFAGYVAGHHIFGTASGAIAGALLATFAIFLPSFVFIALLGSLLPRIRANRYARSALDAMNAAVVALIVAIAFRLAVAALKDSLSVALCLGAMLAMWRWRINSAWIILAAAVLGWAGHAIGADGLSWR